MMKNKPPQTTGPLDSLADKVWPFLALLYNFRNILFGVLFLAYVRFVHPRLLDLLAQSRETGQTYPLLGLMLFTFQIWELAGVWLKLPLTQIQIQRHPNKSALAKMFVGVAQISHLFLALVIFSNMLPFFGLEKICFDYDTNLIPCALTTLAVILILAKELTILALMFRDKAPPPLDLDRPLVKIREMLGEVFLLSFGMVGFTLSWNVLLNTLDPNEPVEGYVIWTVSILLFMILYPASRLVFTMEEWLVKQSWLNRVIIIAFFLFTLAASLAEVPGLF